MPNELRLGLIGDNIGASRAPLLHRIAGAQNNVSVIYDRLVPHVIGKSFDQLFDHVASTGYRGINVTYPYKEIAAQRVQIDDPLVKAMGSVNTVLFTQGKTAGFNTDYSGFLTAYRAARPATSPGSVLMIGAGGVGRSIAFALGGLGTTDLRIADLNTGRAAALGDALHAMFPAMSVTLGQRANELAAGATGLVNATPVGMVGHDGTPLPATAMTKADWAFDAVYTPVSTRFLGDAKAAGLTTVSGYELFIGQGVDAWRLFSGLPIDEARLRADLALETAQ